MKMEQLRRWVGARPYVSAACAAFFLAIFLRCLGLAWGGVHADERLGVAAKLLVGADPLPNLFYPPLLDLLSAMALATLFACGRLLGIWHSAGDFREAYFTAPLPLLLSVRAVVVVLSAAKAPVAVALARRLKVSPWGAFFVGTVLAFLPFDIVNAHIQKHDSPLATAQLFFLLACVAALSKPTLRAAIGVGIAAALAMSFKQNALFYAGPAGLCLLLLVAKNKSPRFAAVFGLAAAAAATFAWVILNFRWLLHWNRFLEQNELHRVAASNVHLPSLPEVIAALEAIGSVATGATPLLLLAACAACMLRFFGELRFIFATQFLGATVFLLVSKRFLPHHYLPFVCFLAFSGCLLLVKLAEAARGKAASFALISLVASSAALLWGTGYGVKQALALPLARQVGRLLLTEVDGNERILAASLGELGFKRSVESIADDFRRQDLLAKKYGVEIPPHSAERLRPPVTDTRYIREMPWVMGGLELTSPDAPAVTGFAWPPQPSEWKLDYWLAQRISVFVTDDEERHENVPMYRDFFAELRDRCTLFHRLQANRPWYWELGATRFYRCPLPVL